MISFVIPAHNEERLLSDTLRSIHDAAKALGEPYEIVVADDASTDRTAAIALECGAVVVKVAHRQIAATRNSGARAASGEFIFFVDADTLVNQAVVCAALNTMRRGAAGGGAAVRLDEPVPLWFKIMLEIVVRIFRMTRLAAGCFLFCTRRAFEGSGGFDEKMFGAEEIAMSQALKRQGRFVVLREAVMTSGRKIRAYSFWEILSMTIRMTLRGTSSVRDRSGMDMWYGERREDPAVLLGAEVRSTAKHQQEATEGTEKR